jgi:GMP synthase (glutamine-hydrolysing)
VQLIDSLTENPLLGYLPKSFAAQTSHSEVVLELPPGAARLATSPLDDNFVIRFTENVWGVQFHPEFSAPVMSEYIHHRAGAIREEGLDPEHLLENTTETEEASLVLRRFVDMYGTLR